MGITLLRPKTPRIISGSEFHPWAGLVRIAIRDERTGRVKLFVGHNLITDVGKDYLAGMLAGLHSVGIVYMALGSSSTAPASADIRLGAEFFRKAITTQAQTAGTKNLLSRTYVASYEANTAISEIGWYAGPAASGTTDSGVLIARVLYSHTKLVTESLQVDRTDQF